MNAAAPKGTPPRRINSFEHFGKHGTAPPYPGGVMRLGALISAIFMVLERTLNSCPVLQKNQKSRRTTSPHGTRGLLKHDAQYQFNEDRIRQLLTG